MTAPLTREQQRLVERALPTVREWVRIFASTWPKVPRDELESVAYLETTECARSYNSERGTFLAYIRLAVRGALMNTAMRVTYGPDARVAAAASAFLRDHEVEMSAAEALDAALGTTTHDARADLKSSLLGRSVTFVVSLVLEHEAASAERDAAAQYDLQRCQAAVRQAVAQLPDKQREVVVSFHENEETLGDIAARRRVDIRTVSRWHDSAKSALAEALKDWALGESG